MATLVAEQQTGFQLQLSPDRATVTLDIQAGAAVTAASVIAGLRDMKLASFDDGLVIEALENRKREAISIVVASGTPAVPPRPEHVDFRVPLADEVAGTIARVTVGQVIGTLVPTVPGVDGRDVFGQPIIPEKDQQPLKIGRNLNVDKAEIIATAAGSLRLNGNVLSVEPLLELRADDDDNPPPVNFDGDMVVRGTLAEGRRLQLSGSLTVGGAIESIRLQTGGSVNVKGGIVGTQSGRFVIGGDLRCLFINGGVVIAGADVHAQSEIVHSRVSCAGRLTVAHGPIYGGAVAANGGISCRELGHLNGVRTIVEAGNSVICRSFVTPSCAAIGASRKRARDIRAKIEPLLKQMKRLTTQQREKATELLYEAEELETATTRMVAERERHMSLLTANARTEIQVADMVHAGVVVRFLGVETAFESAIQGPLTLAARKSGDVPQILLIDGNDRSKSALRSWPIDPIEEAKAEQLVDFQAA
jgi:uncharacterized protein (DUF342 family)